MPRTRATDDRVAAAKTAEKRRVEAVFEVASKKRSAHPNAKINEAVIRKILSYVLEGNYLKVAAQAVGVSPTTLNNWEARAEEWLDVPIGDIPEGVRIYVDFYHAMRVAEAQAEVALLRRVAAGKFGWQACIRILESRHPTRWMRRESVQHEGGDPAKPITTVQVSADEERAKEVASILQAAEAVDTKKLSKGNGRNGHG